MHDSEKNKERGKTFSKLCMFSENGKQVFLVL